MASAVMAHPAVSRLGGRLVIVGGGKPFGVRPLGKNGEEAGDVLGNLPGVFAT